MIKFLKKETKLSRREVAYWRKVFEQNLMIGTEIEIMFDKVSVGTSQVKELLSEIGIGGNPGEFVSPVETVKSDGSLNSGAEIITPGRRIYGFLEQFSMYQAIYSNLASSDPIIDARMGWHNHIVLQNYRGIKAQEKQIPKIIFDNMMMLIKKYYPALCFMTSTLPDTGYHTRYDKFCKHERLKSYDINSTIRDTMSSFGDRYNCVNLRNISTSNNLIDNFHVEFRFPDGTLSPIQMSSINILFKALVLKAVEFSKFGVFNKEIDYSLYNFKNNSYENPSDEIDICINAPDTSTRKSGMLNEESINKIIELGDELVSLLTPEIMSIDKIALPFIKELVSKPVSVLFKEFDVKDIRVINDYYEEKLDLLIEREDESILPLIEIIETGLVKSVESINDWFNKTSELVVFKEPIENIIEKIKKERKLKFNNELGFYFE